MIKYIVRKRINNKTQNPYYMRQILTQNPVSLQDIADEAEALCTLTKADIVAVLASLQEVVMKHLREGRSVRLGMIGSFRLSLQSKGAQTMEKCIMTPVKKINCRFSASGYLRRSLKNKNLKFQEVKIG